MAKDNKTKQKTYEFSNAVVTFYLLAMFSFFPVFLSNYYSHARVDKFWTYLILSSLLLIFSLVLFFSTYLGKDTDKEYRTLVKENYCKLSIPDIAIFAFFIFALISTIFSDYVADSFLGTSGRNNGLIIFFFYFCVYIIITRLYQLKDYVFIVYLAVSSFVAGLAAINYFYIDPFGLIEAYKDQPSVVADFGSTIGNKNTISAFICMFLPIAIMMFVVCKKKYLRIISGVSIVFAYTGLLSADSSSGFLGLIIVIIAMSLFCSRNYTYFTRYLIALIITFVSGKLLRLFSLIMNDNHKEFEAIPKFLIYDIRSYLLIILPLVILLLLLIFKNKLTEHYPAKAIMFTLIGVFSAFILVIVYFFIKYTFIDTTTNIGSFEKLIRFNEKWGTHRGFMWIKGLEAYSKFDLFKILFGSGPDTFYHVFQPYFNQLIKYGDGSTDCIHNEFLNYLVTHGVLGLSAYLTLLISVIVRGVKKAKDNPFVLVTLCAVICYAAQSTVNLYSPIITPLFMIFISITEAFNRETYKTKENAY